MVSEAIVELAGLIGSGIILGGFVGGLAALALGRRPDLERFALEIGYGGGVLALVALLFDDILGT